MAERTSLYCSNCRETTEWADIKKNKAKAGFGVQTHEITAAQGWKTGRWAAHCPGCGMPYGAAGIPTIFEGVDLMRLEGATDAELQKYAQKLQQDEVDRDQKINKYYEGKKKTQVAAPTV